MNNSMESGFMDGFSKIVDTVILAFLWLLCCIPVFTIGAASCGAYYAFHKSIRQSGGHASKNFFKSFGANFKQATIIWVILLIFLALTAFTCYMLRMMGKSMPMAGYLSSAGLVIFGCGVVWGIYLFPYLSRFENTTGNAMKNGAVLAVAKMPWSLLLLVILVACVLVALYKPALTIPMVAVYIWLSNRILESIFRTLMTEEALRSELAADSN